MPYLKNVFYRDMPFSSQMLPNAFFYKYYNVKDLAAKCESNMDEIFNCRVIGIIQSICGRFCVTDINSSGDPNPLMVRLSVLYLKVPPPSAIIPYTVQIFGTVQWKTQAVIYASILQVMNPTMAIRVRDIVSEIANIHLANLQTTPIEDTT